MAGKVGTNAELVAEFRNNLDRLDVPSTVLEPADATAALEDRLVEPVVGTPLPFEDVSLPGSVVTDPDDEELRAAETGITASRLAVASYGSVVVTSNEEMEGPVSLYPPYHVVLVGASDVVADLETALDELGPAFDRGRNDAVFVTGPSSTGDMGELVTGVHGPKRMEVLILDT